MRIENLQYVKSADLKKERLDFRVDKLNLVITATSVARSAVAEAICSILYGATNAAANTEPFSIRAGTLKVAVDQRKYTISRDFADGRISFRELSGVDSEVSLGTNAPGRILTGLDLEMFRDVCMVEERSRGEASVLSYQNRLSSLLYRSTEQSASDEGPDRAIACIESLLHNYQFKSRPYKIDDLIVGLERGRRVLLERLKGLEQEKHDAGEQLAQLSVLEKEITDRTKLIKLEDQFQLNAVIADVDARILVLQERLLLEAELQRELQELGDLGDFPVDVVRKVDELWAKRESTFMNYTRLARDVDETARVVSELDAFLNEHPKLDQLVQEDAQTLYGLARTLESVKGELEELNHRRNHELQKVKESADDFEKVAEVRKCLLVMDSLDHDEATNLAQLQKKSKQELAEAVQVTQRVERDIKEAQQVYDRANKTEKQWRYWLVVVSLSPLAFFVAAILGTHDWARNLLITISVTMMVTTILLSAFVLVLLYRTRKDLDGRVQRLKSEYKDLSQAEMNISSQLADVQRRAERIAHKYEVSTGVELLKHVTSYAGSSAKLKDLDLLDQIVSSREKQLGKIIAEVARLSERAGRGHEEITPSSTVALADDVQRFREHIREREKTLVLLTHQKSELRFLEGEIKDIDSQLRDAFYRARLDEPEELSLSIGQFRDKAANKKRFDSLHRELEQRAEEALAESLDGDLNAVLDALQKRRQEAQGRLQELVTANPFLLSHAQANLPSGPGAAELVRQVEVLNLEYQEVREQIRAVTRNFDDYYPKTQHELELLERDLARIKHHKCALELARNLLQKVAAERRANWSSQLSKTAALLLRESGTRIESIEWNHDPGIRLVIQGQEPVAERDFGQKLSRGMLSQVDWIVKMAVALVVCERGSIPIVLDEPFSAVDDQSFLSSMKLLISLLPKLQIIVLSCHELRHRWLVERLGAADKELIHFCNAAELE